MHMALRSADCLPNGYDSAKHWGAPNGVSRAGVGSRYRDRTRQEVESERHMDVTSESWYRLPAPAPHLTS
jgi:hypothetical protein